MTQSGRFNPTSKPRNYMRGSIMLVAALLLANLVATLCKTDSILPAALAQRQAPIAGGAGMFVMPAQLGNNMWGCYLMDVDRGTLCCYQFFPGSSQLRFVAARKFTDDTKLVNFNTTPAPQEIIDLVNKQNQARNGAENGPDAPDANGK